MKTSISSEPYTHEAHALTSDQLTSPGLGVCIPCYCLHVRWPLDFFGFPQTVYCCSAFELAIFVSRLMRDGAVSVTVENDAVPY